MNNALKAIRSRFAYAFLVFLLLFAAAVYRLKAPGTPFIDGDVRGYLKPALLALTHNGFHSVDGRSFLYPGFIYIVLFLFPTFHAIAAVQHLLGVAAGGLLLAAWNSSRKLVGAAITPLAFYRLLGIPVAALYLFNTIVFRLEHSIRPEAIFPFFSALSMFLNIQFLRYKWVRPNRGAALLLGLLNVFTAFLLFFLKPAFFLATCVCLLPFCLSFFDQGEPLFHRLLAVGAPLIWIPALFFLPEHFFDKDDWSSKTFLPTTLFVIHAKIIGEQISSDITTNAETPYQKPFLRRTLNLLDQEIDISKRTGKYKSLGYDPDYLMYNDSFDRKFLTFWGQEDAPAEQMRFYYYYFFRTWTHRPAQMLRKVLTQISLFYNIAGGISPYRMDKQVVFGEKYATNLTAADLTHNFIPSDYAPLDQFILESKQLADNSYRLSKPAILSLFGAVLRRTFTICFVLAMGIAIVIWRRTTLRNNYLWYAAAVLLLYAYSFANSLGIAFIHSLEIERYSTNQLIYCVLPHAMTIWLAAETFLRNLGFRENFQQSPQ
jgi:hypothetical protein